MSENGDGNASLVSIKQECEDGGGCDHSIYFVYLEY